MRRAIVTGAQAGIGAATAARLVAAGLEVHAIDRDARIAEAPPSGVAGAYVRDIGDPQQIDDVCAEILAGGPVAVLVNSAGVMTAGDAETCSVEDWDRTIAVNARGPWLFARRVIPGMKELGGGVIVSVSSAAGIRPGRERLAYSASKAALIHLTRSIAMDYGVFGIRANTICPGAIDTAMYRSTTPSGKSVEQHLVDSTRAYALGRLGNVDEVAATIEFMVSEAASYMTGAAVTLDGGRTLH
jgi:NAD(P)-dependent dehydrogenase (short-subunit alcohol dehydrogenase family)